MSYIIKTIQVFDRGTRPAYVLDDFGLTECPYTPIPIAFPFKISLICIFLWHFVCFYLQRTKSIAIVLDFYTIIIIRLYNLRAAIANIAEMTDVGICQAEHGHM